MNLNKDYLLTVDIKQATVSVPNNMSFYITDIKTANIFAQLVINESSSELIKKYAPVENAQDFEITLRLIKPNNEPKELKFTLLNQLEAFFMVDLTDEYKDYIGTYNCELFVDCVVNGALERITTSSFSYNVLPSIMNNLDDVIEDDPDYPLVEEILKKIEETGVNVDLSDYAKIADVEAQIAAIELTPGPQGEQGPAGEQGPEGPAGKDGAQGEPGADGLTTAISVNGETYEHINGTITLPDYPNDYATTDYIDDKIGDIDSALSAILGGDK